MREAMGVGPMMVRCEVCGYRVPLAQTRPMMFGVSVCEACDAGPHEDEAAPRHDPEE